jgi:ketosteroid isomerase-like protein
MVEGKDVREMIKALDGERMCAMVAGDQETLGRILSDDMTYVHTSAAVDTKSSIMESIGNGNLNYKKMAARNVQVRDFGDAAVLRGQADVEVTSGGNDLTFSLEFTEVYAKGDAGWQMVAWQSTRLPE